MEGEKESRVWLVVLVISLLFIGWTVFTISNGSTILQNGLTMWAGSSFDVGSVEEKARGFMNMAMIKPLWEEIWIGIIGVFCAVGLRQGMRFSWQLGLIWGSMMLVNGIVQGSYEVAGLGWSMPCPQTYIFLALGIVALVSLLLSGKRFAAPTA